MEGQLTLDLGLLSVEQEKYVADFLESQKRSVERSLAHAERKVQALVNAGFRLGVDFDNTIEVVDHINEDREFGYSWRHDEFTANVTYQSVTGDVTIRKRRLLLDEDDNVTTSTSNRWFSLNSDGKIECSEFVGSYRAVKPETLFRKYQEYNETQVRNLQYKKEERIKERQLIAELTEMYPHAEVKMEESYEGGRYTRRRAMVKFEDGSYANFYKNYNGVIECSYVYDVAEVELTNMEKANRVSQRNK